MDNDKYLDIRLRFIMSFLDTTVEKENREYFERNILTTVDGLLHTGYFFRLFSNKTVVDESEALDFIKRYDGAVRILWDNNIYNADMTARPLFSVESFTPKEFIDNMVDLPKVFYVFDEDFTWAYAFTDETSDGKRYCIKTENKD